VTSVGRLCDLRNIQKAANAGGQPFFPWQPPFLYGEGRGITSWHINRENYFG